MPAVQPKVLLWARETAQLSLEDAAHRLAISNAKGKSAADRLHAFETGDVEVSRPLLLRMANVYRRPLVAFYLSSPPPRGERGQDFRTLPQQSPPEQNTLVDALVRNVRARQSMVRAVIEDEGDESELPFVGSMSMNDGVKAVAHRISEIAKFTAADYQGAKDPKEAFDFLREKFEAIGVFVLLAGNLGSHHSAIDVEVFRGFALADNVAPFVVINDQDATTAWSFTLIHECAHLWLGETGISNWGTDVAIEKFCNEVAATMLFPENQLVEVGVGPGESVDTMVARISAFASARNLSSSMIAYRLFLAEIIPVRRWAELRDYFFAQWRQRRDERRKANQARDGGPNYYVVRRHRVGKALLELVRRNVVDGSLSPDKAGIVLGVKPTNVHTLVNAVAAPGRRG